MKKNTHVNIILVLFILFSPKPIWASENKVVFKDNFSNDLSQWEAVRDDGSLWEIKNGMLEVTVQDRHTITELVPKDEKWNSNWENIQYDLDIIPIEGADRNISFNFIDLLNWFEIHFVGNGFEIAKLDNGIVTYQLYSSGSLTDNQANHVSIKLLDDYIRISVNGQIIAEGNNEYFDNENGKIGLKAGTGAVSPTTIKFDNILVTSLDEDENILDVPDIKQTDPQWADQEYDQATDWSDQPTIARWGCALTSMVMILNYHDIDYLPDGTAITPASLNDWLRSQPDGYIGQGLFNWIAVTRLTRLISEQYQTTKLEYSKSMADHFQTAIDQINLNQPVILQTLGHFLVGKGVNEDGNDLSVNDPNSNQSQFNQLNSELISTRTFTPSQTDLSYLLFVHDDQLKVSITDESGQQITDSFTDTIISNDQQIPGQVIHHIAQPSAGKYYISVNQDQLADYQLEIYSYDQDANLTELHQQGSVGAQPITFELLYPENNISIQNQNCSFDSFRQILDQSYQAKGLKKYYVFSLLDRIADYGQQADPSKYQRYAIFLKKMIDEYRYAMDDSTFELLSYQLCL